MATPRESGSKKKNFFNKKKTKIKIIAKINEEYDTFKNK